MSIKKKIILLVGALSVVTAVVGWAGIVGLERVAEAAAEMNRVGEDAALAEQLTQDVIHISRGEYRIAADPTPENIEEVEKNIAADRAHLEARLAKLKASPDPAVQELVGEVDAALAAYMAKMTETLDKSRKFGTKFTSTALQAIIRQATRASFAAATSLEDAARKLNDHFRVRTAELLAQATAEKEATQRLMLLAALIGITLAAAGGVAAAQGTIVRPIMQSVDCLRRLAQGEADIEVYGLGRRDEIGSIAGAMQAFKESLQRNAQLRAEAERLQLEQAERHRQEMEEIAGSFEASVRGIVQIVSGSAAGVQDSAADLAALSERGMERSSAVALAAERASGNVAAVARSADQLGGAIVRIGRHAEDSLGITREAEAQTAAIRTVMTELGGAVRKIGDVVDLVSGIAHNTNLLALNATIEAARAGEMGKGFAVVAGEVKALSDQTAKATHEISAQIAAIQGVTGQAADSADVIAGIVGRIAELASTISGEVEQQEGASRDILDSINGAAADTRDVSDTIAAVRADSAGTGEASKLLLDAARQLAEQAAHLREDVDRFIAHVRSA